MNYGQYKTRMQELQTEIKNLQDEKAHHKETMERGPWKKNVIKDINHRLMDISKKRSQLTFEEEKPNDINDTLRFFFNNETNDDEDEVIEDPETEFEDFEEEEDLEEEL